METTCKFFDAIKQTRNGCVAREGEVLYFD